MRAQRILGCLVIVSYLLVILNIICDQYFLKAMFATSLGKKDFIFFENDFRIDLPMTYRTEANGIIIVNIISVIVHALQVYRGCKIKV